MKIPKTIGPAIDKLYRLREQRLEAQKGVEKIKAQEHELRQHLLVEFGKQKINGSKGRVASVNLSSKKVPSLKDWGKLCKHIQKTGDFALLSKKVSAAYARELWDDGKKIPGVQVFNDTTFSLTKVSR